MDPWLQAARRAVNAISDGLMNIGESGRQNVDFTATLYRDRDAQEFAIESMGSFTKDTTQFADFLQNAKAFGGDLPGEPVFHAIQEALRRVPFDRESIKILVLLGDDGNNSEEGDLDEDQIAKILVEQGGAYPVGFFAVSVGPPDSQGSKLFRKQTDNVTDRLVAAQKKAIADRLGQFAEDPRVNLAIESVVGRRLSTREPKEMIEAVKARFQLAIAEADAKAKVLADYASGAKRDSVQIVTSDNEKVLRVIWESQLDSLLKSKNLDRIKLATQGVQICEEGWTFKCHPGEPVLDGEKEPIAAYRQVAYMHETEVADFARILGSLADSQQSLGDAWKESLQRVIGERPDSTWTPESIMRMHMGLGVREGLLALTFEEIALRTPAERARIRQSLELSQKRIQDMLSEQEAEYKLVERDGDIFWKRRNDRPRKFWWGEKASAQGQAADRRAWVPREYLP